MSFEEAVIQNDTILPSHIQISPNMSAGLAWDNFDINIETSGANTIHHTYGICYQNIMPSENSQFDFDIFCKYASWKKVQKSTYESKQEHLEPYHKKPKKPKLSNFITTELTLCQPCANYKKLIMQDYIWTISYNMFDKIPMRKGWNVINLTNLPQKQIVCYMKPIQLQPIKTLLCKKLWSIQLILQIQYNQGKHLSHTILQQLRLRKEYNLENPQSMINLPLCLDLFILNFLFFRRLESLSKVQVDPISFLNVILQLWDPWTSFWKARCTIDVEEETWF